MCEFLHVQWMTFAGPPALCNSKAQKKWHNDNPPFNMALRAALSRHPQRGSSLTLITYSTLQEKVSIAKFEHRLHVLPRYNRGQLSCNSRPSSPRLLSTPRLLDKFITSGPQERPDFNSDVLCSIALHGGSCRNGAS